MEFASDVEMKKVSGLADEFFRSVLDEYEPFFVSDEATIWDVSTTGADELLERCSSYYRQAISRQDLDQPLWKILRQLDEKRRKVIFLGEIIEQELVWTVRCKGCGELYGIREVGAGEVSFPVTQQAISCHKTGTPYDYRFNEVEQMWAP